MDILFQFYNSINNIELALLWLFYFAALTQVFYYLFFYSRIFSFKKNDIEKSTFSEPISIIIASHNEAENLRQFLPSVLNQDYPTFEVIVINDRSVDDTDMIIAKFKGKYPNLKSTFIKDNGKLKHGKKLAITLGIKAAQYDYILLTDADCEPISNQWVKEMSKGFSSSDIILGYGPYFQEDLLINRLIRFDTMFIALQYMSFAKAGFTYMGVGRNLAYKKDIFTRNRGLSSHSHIKSGDDDLFINEVANKNNVNIACHSNSFVYSVPENTLKFWVRQKQRHLSTFHLYKKTHQFLLAGEVFSRVFFYVLFLLLISTNISNYYFWSIVFVRMLLSFTILAKSTSFFKEKKLFPLLIILDFIFPILNFFIYLEAKITEKKKW